jgi:hypothetical protein
MSFFMSGWTRFPHSSTVPGSLVGSKGSVELVGTGIGSLGGGFMISIGPMLSLSVGFYAASASAIF